MSDALLKLIRNCTIIHIFSQVSTQLTLMSANLNRSLHLLPFRWYSTSSSVMQRFYLNQQSTLTGPKPTFLPWWLFRRPKQLDNQRVGQHRDGLKEGWWMTVPPKDVSPHTWPHPKWFWLQNVGSVWQLRSTIKMNGLSQARPRVCVW